MSKAIIGFELFKQEMQYNQNSLTLFKSLEHNQFTLQQLLELIYTTPNNQNKSPLIIFFIDELKKNERLFSILEDRLLNDDNPIIKVGHQEDCLIFAIYCFLNGSCKKGSYLSYINLITTQLMNQPYPFSTAALKGLTLLWFRGDLEPLISEKLVSILFRQKGQKNKSMLAEVTQGSPNYHQLIPLCQNAINLLDPNTNQSLINSINNTIEEAKFELELSQSTGFFSRLIAHFRRCYAYGWTGFFNPNLPTCVGFTAEYLPNQSPLYPNPILDFYSVAHFDSLVETSLDYAKEEPKNTSSPLLEMLLVNDFHKVLQDILPNRSEDNSLQVLTSPLEPVISKPEDLLVEIDEDSPFYGLIDPLDINQATNVQEQQTQEHQITMVESAKELVSSATTYAEELIENYNVLDDINAVVNYGSQLYTGLGDVKGWTQNMFFKLAKPVICTVPRQNLEQLPTETDGPGAWS